MNCHHCNHHPLEPTGAHDWFCPMCLLTGSSDVLEALAARLAPAGTLAEAERLLRNQSVNRVELADMAGVSMVSWIGVGGTRQWGHTLYDAYETLCGTLKLLRGGRDG